MIRTVPFSGARKAVELFFQNRYSEFERRDVGRTGLPGVRPAKYH